jgi:hypothetical protein
MSLSQETEATQVVRTCLLDLEVRIEWVSASDLTEKRFSGGEWFFDK